MEGASFYFKNGEVKYLFDDVYANAWKIKSFIQEIVIEKKEKIEISESQTDTYQARLEDFEIFKDNQFTSFRGRTLWGFCGMFLYIGLSKSVKTPARFWIFAAAFCSFWFLLFSYLMHYFELSDNYFVVRNHNLIWINKYYKINDIKEITFETQGKMPNCLRVITKNFQNKLYPAGTLRDHTWIALKEKLEQKGIKVRNELYLD